MRRLLGALAVLLTTSTVPGATAGAPGAAPAAPPRPAAADGLVPGRTALAPFATGEEWVHAFRAAVAGTGTPAREVLTAGGVRATDEYADLVYVFVAPDLDGDRVSDIVRYRSVYEGAITSAEGFTELTVYSGRTGKFRWRRLVEDLALAQPILARVGRDGTPGIVLIRGDVVPRRSVLDDPAQLLDPLALLFPKEDRRVRAVGITNRGRVAYNKTLTTLDGKGDIQFGGVFDAYPGKGDELLFGRVYEVLPGILHAHAVTLDGYDGTLRAVTDVELVLADTFGYLAVSDVERDRRDDFVEIRGLAGGVGTVVARSVAEKRTLWTTDTVPIGRTVWVGGTANVAGDSAREVLLNTWLQLSSVRIAGLPPDDLVLLPRNGTHGVLLDGRDGATRWNRVDGEDGSYTVWDDVNRDGKRDVLAVAEINGERDGLRIIALTGPNAELYRREVTVARPPGDEPFGFVHASAWPGGDLDGDKITDLDYVVHSGSIALGNRTAGLFLAGRNRVRTTPDWSFGDTLDGGTDDRVTSTYARSTASFLFSDGWNGRAYWRVRAAAEIADPTKEAYWWIAPLAGGRGRCADVVLLGIGPAARWVDVLDGGTGRIRWSKTLFGTRPPTSVRATGARVSCR